MLLDEPPAMRATEPIPSRWLLFTTDFRPMRGGIARLVESILDLSPPEIEWRCVTVAPGPAEPGVVRYGSFPALCRSVPSHVRWLAQAGDRRIVNAHAYLQAPALAARLGARGRLTTFVYGTEIIPKGLGHRATLALLRFSDRVVADSRYAASATAEVNRVRTRRLVVVPPVFRSPWISPYPPAVRPPGTGLRLVTVSRLAVHKNIELAIRAVSVLASTGLIDRYTIIGEGPQRDALEQLAAALGVDGLVEFLGGLGDNEVRDVLAGCHVGLFPSRRVDTYFEGFGLVVHELAGAGLPVLAGDAGGTPDACVGAWSVLLDPHDLALWVHWIERLALDEPLRAGLAREAHDWAQAVDSNATVGQYVDAIAGA